MKNFNVGILSDYVFRQNNVLRTADPIFSNLIYGKLKNEFLNLTNNSFDDNSVFGKFLLYNGKNFKF